MAVQFNITYMNVNKTKVFKVFNMPDKDIAVTGTCGEIEQNMTLSWKSEGSKNDSLILHFVQNKTTKHYSLHHLEISVAPEDLPKSNLIDNVTFMHNATEYNTGVSNSYRCFKQQTLAFNVTQTPHVTFNGTAVMTVTDLQFQAFKMDKSTSFGLAEDCAFDTPDYVPIGVGCALAVLVIIVLAGYLISRRRRPAQGYLSM